MSEDRVDGSKRAFFGRRRGKSLKPRQASLYQAQLPQLRIAIEHAPAPKSLGNLFPHQPEKIRLEIGFGGGEHIIHEAQRYPEMGFIGVEPFVNSMAKCLANAAELGVSNMRVYDDDATQLLDWLPPASIDELDLLYPDPWPKLKHWKRRFVNQDNLDRFAHVLKPGGRFRFASDIETYVNWALQHVERHRAFNWSARSANDWRKPFDGWPGTRYEAKALREGRTPAYLTFFKH